MWQNTVKIIEYWWRKLFYPYYTFDIQASIIVMNTGDNISLLYTIYLGIWTYLRGGSCTIGTEFGMGCPVDTWRHIYVEITHDVGSTNTQRQKPDAKTTIIKTFNFLIFLCCFLVDILTLLQHLYLRKCWICRSCKIL